MNTELSRLISLQDLDVEIKRLRADIESLPERREALEREFTESAREYLDLKEQLDTAKAERASLDANLEAEQQKHQKFKDDLGKMTAPNIKVYETIMREIEVSKKAIGLYETELLKLMERIEKLDAQVSERQPAIESRRIEIDRQLAEWDATIDANQQRLEALSVERKPLIEALSPPARLEYDRLSRMKSGLALAEARNYSCMACRMKIRPQVYTDIRRGDSVIICESCSRILYFKAEAATN
ncbi:MAG: C4-type zinc ribbon domain-containing protein [Blastocatellia bacterium]|nr:C4-type zinc ribbon domain-containing protein [Blastocatellia bacterium]